MFVCDVSPDCEDGSDEVNCTGLFLNLLLARHHRPPRQNVSGMCMSVMGHQIGKTARMKSTVQVCFLICLLASHHRAPRHSVSGICMSVMGHQIVKMALMK